MSKQYSIKLGDELISVSEEVYRAYKRPQWNEKKQKQVRTQKECSYDFMVDNGFDMQADPERGSLDEIVTDKLLMDKLPAAIETLENDEQYLIYARFYQDKSERELSRELDIPRKTLSYRLAKVLKKLRKIIESN